MKTKDFDSFTRTMPRSRRRARRTSEGMGFGTALLGVACVVGVFGVLAVLYHFG
jgi:hypothetical protein